MKRIKVTQHAEITVAIEMISIYSDSIKSFEIGISKNSCVWCDEWFSQINQTTDHPDFRITRKSHHGKQPDGWAVPSTSLLPGIDDLMRAFIRGKVDQILNTVEHRHRRSDSTEIELIAIAS